MSHVLGIPLIKGNSNVVIAASLSENDPIDQVGEGIIISLQGGTIEPNIANAGAGRTFGIAMDINACSKKLSVVRAAELVLVRSDGTAPAIGDPAGYDEATGMISATPTHTLSGRIRSGLQTGINGKTGEQVPDCVLIDLHGGDFDGVPTPAVAAAATSKQAK